MAKRHIKLFRYYKEWIETYKKYQISEITYSKYDLTYRYLKKVHPDLYLDELTRQKVQMIIDVKYGGIENAEGTWELKELRDMIGANEDGRKNKRRSK